MVLLTSADLPMIMPMTTWNLLDFRLAEKENCKNKICSHSPGDYDCGKLFLPFVVFRKLLAEN